MHAKLLSSREVGTGDFKSLLMQRFSPHMSWDTGDVKIPFSCKAHVSWDTGDFKQEANNRP